MPVIESTRAATRWITRIVPVILVGAVSYATFVVVGRVCCKLPPFYGSSVADRWGRLLTTRDSSSYLSHQQATRGRGSYCHLGLVLHTSSIDDRDLSKNRHDCPFRYWSRTAGATSGGAEEDRERGEAAGTAGNRLREPALLRWSRP